MQHTHTRYLNLAAGLLVTAMAMPAMADNIEWQGIGAANTSALNSGKWEDTAHWAGGVVPGANDNARWTEIWNSKGPAITTIDAATLTALQLVDPNIDAINVRSLYGTNKGTSYTGNNRRSYLVVNGTESAPITLNVGSTTSPPADAIYSHHTLFMHLNWTNLNIIGTPTDQGLEMRFHRPSTDSQAEAHSFTDTNVTMLAAAEGKGMAIGDKARAGQRLYMTRGSLTITNTTHNAQISLLGHDDELVGHLSGLILDDTVLTTNDVWVDDGARFIFNGANAAAASSISGTLTLDTRGGAALNSGAISVGSVAFNRNAGGAEQFVVGSGATLSLTGAGFTRIGNNNNWSGLLAAGNLDLSGTLKFSPDGVTTQNLIVFGSDIGADTAGYDADYAIGTLDVSDLTAAGALLNVIAAGNETPNAAYVSSLLLGSAGQLDPGSFFTGNANIYYDPSQSDITGTYAFASGAGSLIGLTIPEPASALLLTGGALVMLRRRSTQA